MTATVAAGDEGEDGDEGPIFVKEAFEINAVGGCVSALTVSACVFVGDDAEDDEDI